MKKSLILLLIPLFGNSQNNVVPIIGDSLFMLKTEVSNKMYREFLNELSPEGKTQNNPDSTKWNYPNSYMSDYVDYYFTHSAYQGYPVVNITYKNANAFCKWKTNKLNVNNYGREVLVRLPNEKEWENAAKANNLYAIYPWGTENMRVEKGKYKGKLRANFLPSKSNYLEDGVEITAPVKTYFPNKFGLYNMSGNVEEMVSEKGITKGGSWKDRSNFLRIDSREKVDSASPEVGFRYVVEVIKKGNKPKTSFLKRTWRKLIGKNQN